MRHHAKDISPFITDASDITQRPIGIRLFRGFPCRRDIPKDYLIMGLEARQGLVVSIIPSFIVVDRHTQHLPLCTGRRKRCFCGFHPNVNRTTDKIHARVPEEDARQQPRLAEDLKSVADPQDHPPRRA